MECLEMIAIKTAQSIFCPKPHEAVMILYDALDSIIGQAVLHLEMPEIIRLRIYADPYRQYKQAGNDPYHGHVFKKETPWKLNDTC